MPPDGVVVDVGCGGGSMLVSSRRCGWKGIGFDLSIQAVEYARAQGLDAHLQAFPPCPLADESADAVSFINVLDHLPDPFGALQEAWRILRPGGVLYVRVPNGPFHVGLLRILSQVGAGHLAVFHLYGFGRHAFSCHLPRLGFEIVGMQTAPPSQGWAYSSGRGPGAWLGRALKRIDRAIFWLLGSLGLRRRCWGPSIEVLARKRNNS